MGDRLRKLSILQTVKKKKRKKHYRPLISQVSLGNSGLFWSVPYDTP